MSGKDPMKALHAYLALKRRADSGDTRAKIELAKINTNPQARAALSGLAAAAKALTAANARHVMQAVDDVVGAADEAEELIAGDDLEASDHVAQNLPPGSDSLDHKAQLLKIKWRQLDQQASFARVNPPSVLKGTIGGQQVVRSDDGIALQVANWPGEDPETVPVSFTFAPVEQLSQHGFELATRAIPYGIIQFGTRGMMVKAEVDIGTGCQGTLSASAVTLQVALEPFVPTNLALQQPGIMKLAGMLSFHTIVRTAPLTRTRYREDHLGGGAFSSQIPVPPFSKSVFLPGTGGAGLVLDFMDVNESNIYSFTIPVGGMIDPYPISDDIVFVRVNSQTGPVIFNLSL